MNRTLTSATIALALASAARAGEIIFDQIPASPLAPADGYWRSQIYVPSMARYDCALIDSFSTDSAFELSNLKVSAYASNPTFSPRWMIDRVSSWSVSVWSSRQAAAGSLIGDIAQIDNLAAEYDYDFYLPAAPDGQAALVTIQLADAGVVLPPGEYWIAARASVDIPVHGVSVVVWLNMNDNASVQVNPPGGFNNIPAVGADRVGDAGYRLFGTRTVIPCGPADLGGVGAAPGPDGSLDNNDFIVFIDRFFAQDPAADAGSIGGLPGGDGLFDNNDFIAFISAFFAGC